MAMGLNALIARITDPDGAMAKAGLEDGDYVTGIDGTPFEDQQHLWALTTLAQKKDRVTLTVVRGGARLSVTVDFKAIYRRKGAGGNFGFTRYE